MEENEEYENNDPINTVVAMLKDSIIEINALIQSYESGKIPPAELVAQTFEIGKTFIGWSDDLSDDEALKLIKQENTQIQAYLRKRRLQS